MVNISLRISPFSDLISYSVVKLYAGVESTRKRYEVSLTYASDFTTPVNKFDWAKLDAETTRALDMALFAFARWKIAEDSPSWLVAGSKIFNSESEKFNLAPGYIGIRGFYASLKSCLAGVALVSDMSVNCFLDSGDMPTILARAANMRLNDFYTLCKQGLDRRMVDMLNKYIKNAKILVTHLHHWKKAKSIGPTANSQDSSFDYNGTKVTVEEYFAAKAKSDPNFRNSLPSNGRLRYPFLPTINIGNATKPILIPAELVVIPGGQSRSQVMDGDMTAQMIKYAAVRPDERMKYICDGDQCSASIVNVLRQDQCSKNFGVSNFTPEPMIVPAKLLPQAKVQYANVQVDPGLSGGWNLDRPKQCQFVKPPPRPAQNGYSFGVLIVKDRNRNYSKAQYENEVSPFIQTLQEDGMKLGCKLYQGGPPKISDDSREELTKHFDIMQRGGVRIVIVLMQNDCYGAVKSVSDLKCISTQCIKWKNIMNIPRGFQMNVMIKINVKLGGINHTLISRLPRGPQTTITFQSPPASLSWIFDQHCMLVGVDVSHAEAGSDKCSMAAVVGSMDGCASQYVAHLSSQTARMEIVQALEDAMVQLLNTFKTKNGKYPVRIVVYRDGVSEGQFEQVVANELPRIKGALELCGSPDTKVAIVICQKGHHTRLVFEEKVGNDSTYINPCPGLVVDATGGSKSISSAVLNEFYLNSHAAIQGTAKPCKYNLIYDELGFKLSELELLTYWTTYLYARCNKSVSYATPAYYAHWASKRGKDLSAAGSTPQDLLDISAAWATNALTSMFFI